MKLDEFVEESLIQIITGVKKAQEKIPTGKNSDGQPHVNPDIMYSADNAPKGKYYATQGRNLVHFVDFDIAVTTDDNLKAKGEAGLKVVGLGFATDVEASNQNSTVSRLKFQVPIKYPEKQ